MDEFDQHGEFPRYFSIRGALGHSLAHRMWLKVHVTIQGLLTFIQGLLTFQGYLTR